MEDKRIFNPLDKENIGKSIVEALLSSPSRPLSDLQSFVGAGVYAIYYRGSFLPYRPLAHLNSNEDRHPIYVGKAMPKGGRKGLVMDASMDGTGLYDRLRDHAKSVIEAENLEIADFHFRQLILDDVWISLGEALLIQRFQPLWNQVVEGFGNHHPGGGRKEGMRPVWDELHPGRSWAALFKAPKLSRDEIIGLVRKHFANLAARPV